MSAEHPAKSLRPQAQAGLLLLLVFLVGGLTGAALDRYVLRPPVAVAADAAAAPTAAKERPSHRRSREAYVRQLQEELALTPDQVARIDVITKEREARMKALVTEVRPRFHSLIEETRAELDKVLTPDQRAKLKELRAREHRERAHDSPRDTAARS